jgi:transposase
MKHALTLLLALTVTTTAMAATKQAVPPELARLAQTKLGKDFRITFTLMKNYNVCGSVGDAYVGQVEMNGYQRGYTTDGSPEVTDRWVKLDKHYAIAAEEILNPNAELFDSDTCME